jgi:glycine oxidase
MGALSSLKVTVGGAGVFGLAIALTLARRGARVTLADPALGGDNASSVAAGMLAPALESALDPLMAGRFGLLKQARDLWPAFVEELSGVHLHQDGALFEGPAGIAERLADAGAAFERRGQGVFTPEDWRIEPRAALAAMRARLIELGGETIASPVQAAPAADMTVLACGYVRDLAPELAKLTPIRGQLLRFEGGPAVGPILRRGEGYLAPGRAGAVVGATMDAGRSDLDPDAAATAALLKVADQLSPGLASTPFKVEVGVRAATPDGLPLVGASVRSGVFLAAGARRNGWLLAPLVAETLADLLAGPGKTEAAALFASDRFRSAGGGGD